mmetsp:Transcript_70641/g.169286  ORF Transcript_70641/g.169286 Transcript_70641/m.169286 type:complete len:220 (+) Transcript_70641:94-753(+)|eukprot:CAMPEP_0178442694 /NCGR_PEP_ID=MMETSP0689_2-20121128/38351_1 /TAXON_ID=160604 /ORGANISM="Amphidinium massartii, Strain CS-259" /LENGTH=219 /DNA_ID=CAMNT_0020066357 /DNA_START=53 /DNA_END=712 /DNA_ORIENTATION=-
MSAAGRRVQRPPAVVTAGLHDAECSPSRSLHCRVSAGLPSPPAAQPADRGEATGFAARPRAEPALRLFATLQDGTVVVCHPSSRESAATPHSPSALNTTSVQTPSPIAHLSAAAPADPERWKEVGQRLSRIFRTSSISSTTASSPSGTPMSLTWFTPGSKVVPTAVAYEEQRMPGSSSQAYVSNTTPTAQPSPTMLSTPAHVKIFQAYDSPFFPSRSRA